MRNVGGADTTNLVGDLDETGGVGDAPDPAEFGLVVAGGADVCADVTFTADETLVCGDGLTADPRARGRSGGPRDARRTPSRQAYPSPPSSRRSTGWWRRRLPAGWAVSGTLGVAPWVTNTTSPDTAPNAAFVDDPAIVTDRNLDSPSIPITTASARLSFRNYYVLESNFDGGVLEIAIGGNPFEDIVAAGGSFVSGGYNATIASMTAAPSPGVRPGRGTPAPT